MSIGTRLEEAFATYEELVHSQCLRLLGNDGGHLFHQIWVERASLRNWTVEDSGIPYQEPVDTFRLHHGRNAKGGILHQIVLSALHALCDPLLRDRVPNVERTCLHLHVLHETSVVEGIGRRVDPIGDITLHQLRGLVLNCHPLQQIRNTVIDACRRVLVDSASSAVRAIRVCLRLCNGDARGQNHEASSQGHCESCASNCLTTLSRNDSIVRTAGHQDIYSIWSKKPCS